MPTISIWIMGFTWAVIANVLSSLQPNDSVQEVAAYRNGKRHGQGTSTYAKGKGTSGFVTSKVV